MKSEQFAEDGIHKAIDASGRTLVVQSPSALDTLRLFKAAGSKLAQNEAWLAMAGLACAVKEIDGVPVPMPTNEGQIEALVSRLGDVGLKTAATILDSMDSSDSVELQAGNSPGTLF